MHVLHCTTRSQSQALTGEMLIVITRPTPAALSEKVECDPQTMSICHSGRIRSLPGLYPLISDPTTPTLR